MAELRVGTCSWTDKTLLGCGRFYPADVVNDPVRRLQYYATHFNTVEVDSSYYHLPSERNSVLWVERTPDDFVFNIKAYKTLTLHEKGRLPTDLEWHMFRSALCPLHDARKLGYVLFQYPPWYKYSQENMKYMLECRDKLSDYNLAFQFRHGSWMWPSYRQKTIDFMRRNRLLYVSVDEPQYRNRSTIPPVVCDTVSKFAVVRFNGRNSSNWFKKSIPVHERFHYCYTYSEIKEWIPRVRNLLTDKQVVYAMFNNCFEDDAIVNAKELVRLLQD